MPYEYDPKTRTFTDGRRTLNRVEIRAKIEKLLDYTKRQATRIATRFDDGKINGPEFNLAMRELLKASHIVSATVGRGGRERMTAKDWGRVGAKVKWQYEFLDKFSRKLASGTLSKAATANRARSYVSAVYISYADSRMASDKEGATAGDDSKRNELQVRLITNSEEGCVECAADEAAGWMPVSDMGELGTRICGDFCKCELEFEDEI